MIEAIVSILLLIGGAFVLLSAFGLVKLPDFSTRLHAATKASTLGVGSIALASLLHYIGRGEGSLAPLLLFLFIFISAPVSAYMLARCAHHEQHRDR